MGWLKYTGKIDCRAGVFAADPAVVGRERGGRVGRDGSEGGRTGDGSGRLPRWNRPYG